MKNTANSQEKLFQAHIESEKISGLRTLSVLASILFLIFSVADFLSLSVSLKEVLVVRGVVVLTLLTGLLYSYHKSFIKNYTLTLSLMFLISTLGVEIMILLALPKDHASSVYFVGLVLIIMSIYAWSYFKLTTSIVLTSFIIGSYYYVEVLKDIGLLETLVNILFLLGSTSIGITFQLIRDRYIRENFILQQSLHEKVEEKTKEAETHEHLANHDQLTGLANSRYAKDKLEEKLSNAKESGKSLVIMYLDLNGFKQVNDIYGHRAGDEVLRIVGKRLKSCVRNHDCLARLGGDEFGIGLVVDSHELGIAQEISEKIEEAVAQPIGFEGNVLQIGTSIGMASYPENGNHVNVLIEIADKKMYKAKQKMKNKISDEVEEIEFSSNEESKSLVIFPVNCPT